MFRSNDLQRAFSLFYSAPLELQSHQAYGALFQACAEQRNLRHGIALHHHMLSNPCFVLTSCRYEAGKQVHGLALKLGLHCSVYVANALISMYGRCLDGYEAWTVFEAMEFKNLVAWNSMIASFQCCNLGKEAVGVFMRMRSDGVGFDRATLLNVCSSLYKCSDLVPDEVSKCCLQLHCLSVKSGFVTQAEVATALVKVYSEVLGEFSDCYKLFMEMSHCRDIVAWTGIITAFAVYDPEMAIHLFGQLRQEKLSPDWYTFSSVLKACAGLVTARQALTIHAQVIKGGFGADTVLNNSLIHAYAKCGSLDLCKRVFDDMDSRDVLSNIYSAEGSFNEASKSRKEMETWRVRKEPGLSWTEIGNKVHEFASGGRRRADREAIYKELERLIGRLKEMGYVPEMRSALQDIEEEEQKEEHLLHHSEKLALAFAVMEGRRRSHDGGVALNLIQIMKNIRICIDCHNFMKLASKLLGKEILVRDSNRFHHFKDSSCSCNDYW
ncbi:hypothetical protein HID58_027606 [Brassica napus]|uniref:DYW domain-containing protein n=1 Tax=Brassica napus TaxID=3708 RepID=A0ABQ8CSD6_BRANA|nr:hypothetical protein HID58_027606 [Brassica napus]